MTSVPKFMRLSNVVTSITSIQKSSKYGDAGCDKPSRVCLPSLNHHRVYLSNYEEEDLGD